MLPLTYILCVTKLTLLCQPSKKKKTNFTSDFDDLFLKGSARLIYSLHHASFFLFLWRLSPRDKRLLEEKIPLKLISISKGRWKIFQKYLKTSFNEFYQSLTRVMISQDLEKKCLICFNLKNWILISISPLGQQGFENKISMHVQQHLMSIITMIMMLLTMILMTTIMIPKMLMSSSTHHC